METAHNITRVGLARVGGRHLSEAPKEPFTEAQLQAGDLENNRDKAERAAARNDLQARILECRMRPWTDVLWRGM